MQNKAAKSESSKTPARSSFIAIKGFTDKITAANQAEGQQVSTDDLTDLISQTIREINSTPIASTQKKLVKAALFFLDLWIKYAIEGTPSSNERRFHNILYRDLYLKVLNTAEANNLKMSSAEKKRGKFQIDNLRSISILYKLWSLKKQSDQKTSEVRKLPILERNLDRVLLILNQSMTTWLICDSDIERELYPQNITILRDALKKLGAIRDGEDILLSRTLVKQLMAYLEKNVNNESTKQNILSFIYTPLYNTIETSNALADLILYFRHFGIIRLSSSHQYHFERLSSVESLIEKSMPLITSSNILPLVYRDKIQSRVFDNIDSIIDRLLQKQTNNQRVVHLYLEKIQMLQIRLKEFKESQNQKLIARTIAEMNQSLRKIVNLIDNTDKIYKFAIANWRVSRSELPALSISTKELWSFLKERHKEEVENSSQQLALRIVNPSTNAVTYKPNQVKLNVTKLFGEGYLIASPINVKKIAGWIEGLPKQDQSKLIIFLKDKPFEKWHIIENLASVDLEKYLAATKNLFSLISAYSYFNNIQDFAVKITDKWSSIVSAAEKDLKDAIVEVTKSAANDIAHSISENFSEQLAPQFDPVKEQVELLKYNKTKKNAKLTIFGKAFETNNQLLVDIDRLAKPLIKVLNSLLDFPRVYNLIKGPFYEEVLEILKSLTRTLVPIYNDIMIVDTWKNYCIEQLNTDAGDQSQIPPKEYKHFWPDSMKKGFVDLGMVKLASVEKLFPESGRSYFEQFTRFLRTKKLLTINTRILASKEEYISPVKKWLMLKENDSPDFPKQIKIQIVQMMTDACRSAISHKAKIEKLDALEEEFKEIEQNITANWIPTIRATLDEARQSIEKQKDKMDEYEATYSTISKFMKNIRLSG